jgi:cell division septum initiation protein DivIVA
MEVFPAADATPWELIRRIISDSDYYVLIVGGKYGSVDERGISYTEREYDLAIELDKPVLAFLHADPGSIPLSKSEESLDVRKKLDSFRAKVQQNGHCKYWENADKLKAHVIIALTWAIQTNPRPGWVRADGINNPDLLLRLSQVQAKYDSLLQENEGLKKQIEETSESQILAQGKDKFTLSFSLDRFSKEYEEIQLAWDEIFFGIGGVLAAGAREVGIREALSPIIFGAWSDTEPFRMKYPKEFLEPRVDWLREHCSASQETIRKIVSQFAALGLIEPSLVSLTHTEYDGKTRSVLEEVWKLTDRGRKKFFTGVAEKRDGERA